MIYNKIVQNFEKQTKKIDKTSSNKYNNVNNISEYARMLDVACLYQKCI